MLLMSVRRDEFGSVLVEFAILLPVVITVLFGSVDLLSAFYQWNAAAKAVEVGARIAAVSDPVASGLNGLSNQAVFNGSMPGSVMPAFTVTCDGSTASCTCTAGTCPGLAVNSYDATAMNRIVFGRGSAACGDATSYFTIGMCDVLPAIKDATHVQVVYTQTGLGYSGRPGGPVPTITVSLKNMQFTFFFLGSFLRKPIAMPAMTTTITAEDLCSGGGNGSCGS
jgi:Flp pilus assembly protein TadG